jgi:hypothetical protein
MLSEFRYNKLISFVPSYEQFVEKYLEDQIQFLNMLPHEIKKEAIQSCISTMKIQSKIE